MAVVVAYLIQKNRSLKTLRLDEAYLPIQQLIGNDRVEVMNLSGQKLTSADTIVIGSLLAENPHIKKIDLRDNEFAMSEGENFIAYALERNPRLVLDSRWKPGKMYSDGYRALASIQGISASGAAIEPQRLEGCFYQSLTGLSAVVFYYNLLSDVLTIHVFASKPEVYSAATVGISCGLICLPTVMYGYNTFVNMIAYDANKAVKQTAIVVFQLLAAKQAYECIRASMETTEMLDYKYVQGVYKSMPQIFFKSYVMFSVAIKTGTYDFWVGSSALTALFSLTVIFIMLFDRKAARRISMAAIEHQPLCAIWLADVFACTGMGNDNENVKGFVNFNAFYTSHYVWSYVFQILSLGSRVLCITWLLASVGSYASLVLFIILYVRCLLMCFLDERVFKRTLFTNSVDALALCISDSAWHKVDDDPLGSRLCLVGLCAITTLENIIAVLYSAYISPPSVYLEKIGIEQSLFISAMVVMVCRWIMLFHWTLHIHFPELYMTASRGARYVLTQY